MLTFSEKVRRVVKKIPRGKTLTYKEVARLAGSPGASRAVGNVLSKNYDPEVPCHRVIRSDGAIGGYNRGQEQKIKLLRLNYKGQQIDISGGSCKMIDKNTGK